MTGRVSVGVVFGGRSGEHEVSLMSARSVMSVLSAERYDVTQIGITQEGRWVTGKNVLEALESGDSGSLLDAVLLPQAGSTALYATQISGGELALKEVARLDVVFPVLHGTYGEDGCIQGLFELANMAYVGAGVLSSAVGMDKGLFKDVMRANDLPVLASSVFTRDQIQTQMDYVIDRAEKIGRYPFFVKPANMGSSVGISKCRDRESLKAGLLNAARYDRRILVERGIAAREVEVSVLGNQSPKASLPGEIIPHDDFYTYDAKYYDDHTELLVPASLDAGTTRYVQELALKTYRVCDCNGMARVDFLIDRYTNEVFISEYNTIPGFTRVSMYPKLWEASGLTYPDLVKQLIDLAIERKADVDRLERHYRRTA